jgi:hypothetical protein
VWCRWNLGWDASHFLIAGDVWVSRCHRPVHVEIVGHLVVDLGQELLELDRAMATVQRADHRAVGGVERREQTGHTDAAVLTALTRRLLSEDSRPGALCEAQSRKPNLRCRPHRSRAQRGRRFQHQTDGCPTACPSSGIPTE